MRFVTNTIKTGKGRSFEELVAAKYQEKENLIKASAAKSNVKVAEADEADSSGQPEAEAKLVNTPKVENDEKVSVSQKSEGEGPDSGQPAAEAKLVNIPKKPTEASEKVTEKVAKKEEKKEEEKEASKETTEKVAETEECEEKEEEKCEEKEEEEDKEANKPIKFVKIATLDEKTKGWLRDYWSNIFPSEYVDAMLMDK